MSRRHGLNRRRLGNRRYKKVFVIATEGAKTEPGYFAKFNSDDSSIHVRILRRAHKSSPKHLLKDMTKYLHEEDLQRTDEAWIVVDKDEWTDEQLCMLCDWAKGATNRRVAVSNPAFEYWLLVHFEAGNNVTSLADCRTRLRRHLPNYRKNVEASWFKLGAVKEAVRRAKARDNPPCPDWPRTVGTTVYRLVESMLKADAQQGD